ncbi:hypothetical protein ACSBR2_003346 [Camellia fascicularis]
MPSFRANDSGSLVEYVEDLAVKILKTFCQEYLPRFSKCIDSSHFELLSGTGKTLPKVMLLSTKKYTPVIWHVLSGSHHKRFSFYDAEVHDVSDPTVRRLGVDVLPAVVVGISLKDINSAVQDLTGLLDVFEKKNQKAASSRAKKEQSESGDKQITLLAGTNFDALCGETTPVCIIGVFRSSRARDKLETVLSSHSSVLNSFDKSGFKSFDNLLVAYKPQKGKFAAFIGGMTTEEVKRFISSVLNGDVRFTKTRQKPKIK